MRIVRDIPKWFTDKSELFTSIRFDGSIRVWFRAINKHNNPKSIITCFSTVGFIECCLKFARVISSSSFPYFFLSIFPFDSYVDFMYMFCVRIFALTS